MTTTSSASVALVSAKSAAGEGSLQLGQALQQHRGIVDRDPDLAAAVQADGGAVVVDVDPVDVAQRDPAPADPQLVGGEHHVLGPDPEDEAEQTEQDERAEDDEDDRGVRHLRASFVYLASTCAPRRRPRNTPAAWKPCAVSAPTSRAR